jgi:tryptophan-rich sensory protein
VGLLGLCLLVGIANGAITGANLRNWYMSLSAPPGTPPNWVFGPVWAAVYLMIGIAAWLVWQRVQGGRPLRLWGWQLLLNALWTPAFFGLHSPPLGLAVLAALLGAIVVTARAFARVSRLAAWLMAPYGVWVAYATYLDAGFWWMNRV